MQSDEGGWHLLDAPVIDSSDPSTLEGAGRTLGYAVGNDVNNRAWDWTNFTSKADTGFLNNPTGLTTTSGVSVGGNLEVTGDLAVSGGITSDSFTYSRAVALQDGNLSPAQYLALAGKRIIQSGSTDPTYTLFQPVAADVGKSWIICNPSTKDITIDPDTQNVWILDGVTLVAKESSWRIKKGGVAEIVCIASHASGGGTTQANFVIFGAGVIEL